MSERHSRQSRLAEIGPEGQRRIASSVHVVLGQGLAAKVEARYLAGAGAFGVDVKDESVARALREVDGNVKVRLHDHDEEHEQDPAWARELSGPARDVALGAYRALRALRRVGLAEKAPSS